MPKNKFTELKPNLYHPDCIAVWMLADDIERSTYNTLNQYDIHWGCQPKLEWFDLSDDDSHLILNLPIMQLTSLPDDDQTMRIVAGASTLLWIMGTNLNEVMVLIFKDQHSEWLKAGIQAHPANLGDHIRVDNFDVDGMIRLKRGSSAGGWFNGLMERVKTYRQGVVRL